MSLEPKRTTVLHRVRSLSFGTKLLTIVGVMAVVTLCVGVVSIAQLARLNGLSHDLYQSNVQRVAGVQDMTRLFLDTENDELLYTPATVTTGLAKAQNDITTDRTTFAQDVANFDRGSVSGAEASLLSAVKRDWNSFGQVRSQVLFPLLSTGNMPAFALAQQTDAIPLVISGKLDLTKLQALEAASARDRAQQAINVYRQSETLVIAVMSIGLILAIVLALLIIRFLTRRLNRTVDVLGRVAIGDLTHRLVVDSEDEVGRLGETLNLTLERMEAALIAIRNSADTVGASSEELAAVSTQMGANAQETSARAVEVSSTAETVSASVDAVAKYAQEMGESIGEVARSASEAATAAGTALDEAQSTHESVSNLMASSDKIGTVIELISSIAEQTNLLALNATIEAARAGDAGKGFAVVANEVKELARTTARATTDISAQITTMQEDTARAVAAISEISDTVAKMSDSQTAIAAAVEQQTATTGDITRSASVAASGSSEIAESVDGVATVAQSTSQGAISTQQAAAELAQLAGTLQGLISAFKVTPREVSTRPFTSDQEPPGSFSDSDINLDRGHLVPAGA